MRSLAIALVVFSGCFGMCDYTPTNAHWTDPALWDALDAPIEPADGMDIGVEHFALRSIEIGVRGAHAISYRGGALTAHVEGNVSGLEDAALRFFENTTHDPTAEMQAFIDTRRESDMEAYRSTDDGMVRIMFYEYHYPIEIDVAAFLERIDYDGNTTQFQQGPFRLVFDAATKTSSIGNMQLVVDARGEADMSYDWAELTSDEEVLADVQAGLRAQGLPTPDHVAVEGYVC